MLSNLSINSKYPNLTPTFTNLNTNKALNSQIQEKSTQILFKILFINKDSLHQR